MCLIFFGENIQLLYLNFFSVRFRLDETGDVTWTVSDELMKSVPLFSCETYEIYSTTVLGVVLRFGAYAGHVIKFKVNVVRYIYTSGDLN